MGKILAVIIVSLTTTGVWAQISNPQYGHELRGVIETGAFGFRSHHIQFGLNGTKFDYVKQGRQNILFPFARYSFEFHLLPRHTLIMLYQPLDIRTATTLTEKLILDNDTLMPGTPINLRYGFDFYRISYLHDLWRAPERELSFGLSLQLRNASISFASLDGKKQRVYQNLGPVPIIKTRLRLPLSQRFWFGAEVDGFYAQGSIVTGSTNVENSFKGAILDGSVRFGAEINRFLDCFVNLRYLGGGGEGKQKTPDNPGSDGYSSNWLSSLAFSIGLTLH